MTALTQDRIKAATIFANKEINSDLEMITHGRIYGQDVTEMEGDLECMRTCLAALDAVRWRDVETEPPETNATVLVRWKAENGVQGYKFSYFEDGNWYGNSGYKIVEWLPLPTWE